MKQIIKNYTFDKVTKQITFSDFATIELKRILLVTYLTAPNNTIIYLPQNSLFGGSVSGNVLTLTYDTNLPAFSNTTTDLQIEYDYPSDGSTPAPDSLYVQLQNQVDSLTGMIPGPLLQDYTLDSGSVHQSKTLNSLTIYTSSGTATVTIKINGVSVTGLTGLSITSTPQTFNATALNSVAVGQTIVLTISAINAATNLSFTLKMTRSST